MYQMSHWEKHKFLRIIISKKPQRWEDIARCYGWIGGPGGGLKGNELHSYIMFGLQILKQEKLISVNITYNSTRFDSLVLRPRGWLFLLIWPIYCVIRWGFVVGVVSIASIKTLFGPLIEKLLME